MCTNKISEVIKFSARDLKDEFSGERYVPGLSNEMELEHIHRYLAVRELCRGKSVLDIASGEGYGSALLAQVAAKVFGVEIDKQAVDFANDEYSKENLEFLCGDVCGIPLGDNSVDVVVSFETLEHISPHEEFLREIRRVLLPGGVLIISTPDKPVYAEVSGGNANPYHISELALLEFRELLASYFGNVSLYGQRVTMSSGIFNLNSEAEVLRRFFRWLEEKGDILSEDSPQKPVYILAVASDGEVPKFPEGLCEGALWINPISSFAGGVQERDTKIGELNAKVNELNAKIDELKWLQHLLPSFIWRFLCCLRG